MAKIILENMEFYAFHGCYAEERKIGCTYRVSVELTLDLDAACRSDQLSDTINYETVYQLVKCEMEQPSNLIEHVAFRIKQSLLAAFPTLEGVTVTLTKLAPPLGGKIESAKVVI